MCYRLGAWEEQNSSEQLRKCSTLVGTSSIRIPEQGMISPASSASLMLGSCLTATNQHPQRFQLVGDPTCSLKELLEITCCFRFSFGSLFNFKYGPHLLQPTSQSEGSEWRHSCQCMIIKCCIYKSVTSDKTILGNIYNYMCAFTSAWGPFLVLIFFLAHALYCCPPPLTYLNNLLSQWNPFSLSQVCEIDQTQLGREHLTVYYSVAVTVTCPHTSLKKEYMRSSHKPTNHRSHLAPFLRFN